MPHSFISPQGKQLGDQAFDSGVMRALLQYQRSRWPGFLPHSFRLQHWHILHLHLFWRHPGCAPAWVAWGGSGGWGAEGCPSLLADLSGTLGGPSGQGATPASLPAVSWTEGVRSPLRDECSRYPFSYWQLANVQAHTSLGPVCKEAKLASGPWRLLSFQEMMCVSIYSSTWCRKEPVEIGSSSLWITQSWATASSATCPVSVCTPGKGGRRAWVGMQGLDIPDPLPLGCT